MTSQNNASKRWRLRFSVRTLAVLVTLICLYLGLWRETNTRGHADVILHVYPHSRENHHAVRPHVSDAVSSVSSPCPLVVCIDFNDPISERRDSDANGDSFSCRFRSVRRCYLWAFGYIVQLPMEGEPATVYMSGGTIAD